MRVSLAVVLLLLGLLVGACTVYVGATYEESAIHNDTQDLRAQCQSLALRPSHAWVYPGEQIGVHRGRVCAIYAASGAFFGCLPRREFIDDGVHRLSEISIDTRSTPDDCLQSKGQVTPLDGPRLRSGDEDATGSLTAEGGVLSFGFLMVGGWLLLSHIERRRTQ